MAATLVFIATLLGISTWELQAAGRAASKQATQQQNRGGFLPLLAQDCR